MASIPLPTFSFLSQSHLHCQQTPALKNPWSIGSHRARVRVRVKAGDLKGLEVLYDDGHGTVGISEFIDAMKDLNIWVKMKVDLSGGSARLIQACRRLGMPRSCCSCLVLMDMAWDSSLHHKALGRVLKFGACMFR
ncbi:hypothetical protein IHE45_06G020300 [Dioscorea alata]|uniref:Uncharacterized protein n=1 Tax=Dioscorea alata TaxID=55571 RepID=A0ACB7VVM9_DIOAL|nr:hypothetical protein IHE45_06G020300 [Dioscorea alata]